MNKESNVVVKLFNERKKKIHIVNIKDYQFLFTTKPLLVTSSDFNFIRVGFRATRRLISK
jgi:hypothetical protein